MKVRSIVALTMTLAGTDAVIAQVTGFVNNPTGNSTDFAAAVAANGSSVNTTMNFDTAALGPLPSNLYSGLGVTLTATGIFGTVVNNAGPNQVGNTAPKSQGEGPTRCPTILEPAETSRRRVVLRQTVVEL